MSAGIRESTGTSISASAIQQLRTGSNRNPKLETIRALATFFGVPPAYFFDAKESEQIEAELALLTTMRDADVRAVALRAAGLSTETLSTISGFIERARALEGFATTREAERVTVVTTPIPHCEDRRRKMHYAPFSSLIN
ncbi:helix-turn-helix domain-containing protein [Streptomyces sp. M10(2022)]